LFHIIDGFIIIEQDNTRMFPKLKIACRGPGWSSFLKISYIDHLLQPYFYVLQLKKNNGRQPVAVFRHYQ